jgi:hypothetical protein
MNEQAEFKTTYEGLINRTTSLESEIKAVVDAVGSLANSVGKIGVEFGHIAKEVGIIKNDIKEVTTKKFEWSTLIAGIVLLIGLWGAAINPIENSVKELKANQALTLKELVVRSEFIGKTKAGLHLNRVDIDNIKQSMIETLSSRFTNADGDKLETEINQRINTLENLVFEQHVSKSKK